MTATVRYATVVNPSGDDALTSALVNKGQDYVTEIIKRTFSAGDIGDDPGQTKDSTDPTGGCLIAQFKGAPIITVTQAFYRPTDATNRVFNKGVGATTVGWRVSHDVATGISSLYIFDTGVDGAALAAADFGVFMVIRGRA